MFCKILKVFFVLLCCFGLDISAENGITASPKDAPSYEERLTGMTFCQLVEKYGPPTSLVQRVIGYDYDLWLIDPSFSRFFSEDEMTKSITILYAGWSKEDWIILVWLRIINNDIIVFSSLEYDAKRIVF
jgi:hypothetical protein